MMNEQPMLLVMEAALLKMQSGSSCCGCGDESKGNGVQSELAWHRA